MSEPTIVRIVGAVVNALKAIDPADDPVYSTRPVDVRAAFVTKDVVDMKPALYVEVRQIADMPEVGQSHRATATVYINCISAAKANAEEAQLELLRLSADVMRAIAKHEPLKDEDGTLVYEVPRIVAVEPALEAMEQTGMGISVVVVEFPYRWTHDAP